MQKPIQKFIDLYLEDCRENAVVDFVTSEIINAKKMDMDSATRIIRKGKKEYIFIIDPSMELLCNFEERHKDEPDKIISDSDSSDEDDVEYVEKPPDALKYVCSAVYKISNNIDVNKLIDERDKLLAEYIGTRDYNIYRKVCNIDNEIESAKFSENLGMLKTAIIFQKDMDYIVNYARDSLHEFDINSVEVNNESIYSIERIYYDICEDCNVFREIIIEYINRNNKLIDRYIKLRIPEELETAHNSIDLSIKLATLYRNKEFHDVTFVINGREKITGIRALIMLASDCFKSMLLSGMRESQTNIININDENIDAATFGEIMRYIHTNTIKADNISSVAKLLYICDMYQINGLKSLIDSCCY